MEKKIAHYWHVFWLFRKLNLMIMFEKRADFFFWGFVSVFWSMFNFFFAFVLVESAGQIGGWTKPEIFVLISVFTMYDAFTWSFFYWNMNRYTQSVFSGELDVYLLKPIDTQFYLCTQHNSYNNVFRFLLGVVMLSHSFYQLSSFPSILQIFLFIILFSAGLLLLYAVWFSLSTLCFWIDRLNNINDIIPSLRRISQAPHTVYTGIFTFLFSGIIPLAIITSIPAEAVLGRLELTSTAYLVILSITYFLFSRVFFQFSLKRYSGAAG